MALYDHEVNVMQEESLPVPAIFGFGDSLLDTGNNNMLRTLAKANHPPYGQDFPPSHTATGRFVNGYNALDFLAVKLGLPLTPTHSDPLTKGSKLLHGANFASAASGVQPYTGRKLGKVFSLDAQIRQFAEVKQEIIAMIGANATDHLLAKSLFYIATGSNDWLFFLSSPLTRLYTKLQFRDLVIAKYMSQIKELYGLGARRVMVAGLGAIGCCPSQRREYKVTNGTCVGWLNDLGKDFNDHLRSQVVALIGALPGADFAFQDANAAILNAYNNPSAFGFTVVDHACCGIGKYGGFLNCLRGFPVCGNVEDHLFWDSFHPSSKFQEQFVDLVWNNGPPYSYPHSGKQLLAGFTE
ncbi:hypothetical protein L7F22_045689 [Adiantum nelumboides]|nr:hypothetical protein [Adiantum nelumboides]